MAKRKSKLTSKAKEQTSESLCEDKASPESAERDTFLDEVNRLTLLRFELHSCLMDMLQYLGAYEEVGLYADNKRSAEMALCQLNLLERATQQAAEWICQLPQTEFMIELHTALQMIRQKLSIARTCAENSIEDGEDQEGVIRCVRQAVLQSHEQIGPTLNRLAAELLTRELGSEIRDATANTKSKLALVEMIQQAEGSGKGDEVAEPEASGILGADKTNEDGRFRFVLVDSGRGNVIDAQVFFEGTDLKLPAGDTISVLRKLYDSLGGVVQYQTLDLSSNTSNASPTLKNQKRRIMKHFKSHKVPYVIESRSGVGYILRLK